jgi:hypothetical protein
MIKVRSTVICLLLLCACTKAIHKGALETLKERTRIPLVYDTLSVSQMVKLGQTSDRGDDGRGICLDGYILEAAPERDEKDNDIHIWIAGVRGDNVSQCVVAEVTDLFKPEHPEWTTSKLNSLVVDAWHVHVRIWGWLLWDTKHAAQVGKYRATQWEIHPVTKIEVLDSAGSWIPL